MLVGLAMTLTMASFVVAVTDSYALFDYRLASGAAGVDDGDRTLLPGFATTDLDGGPRDIGANVDLGAYER